ncbi:transmembrane protein 109 [Mugil cephalus]|uniref:transmembrane protein 109 n=1 Tax=Mugil cephalus TaxID=48193 RepID=UPI001FB7CA64|nr:transmembrane protein 109 [Mugil cephalus]
MTKTEKSRHGKLTCALGPVGGTFVFPFTKASSLSVLAEETLLRVLLPRLLTCSSEEFFSLLHYKLICLYCYFVRKFLSLERSSPPTFALIMCSHSNGRAPLVLLCLLGVFVLRVSGEKVLPDGSPGLMHELRAALAHLTGEGRTYLSQLAGEQTVLSVQKAFSQVLGVLAESLAAGVNTLLQYISHFLQAAGIQVGFPIDEVTSEGLIFVAQWALMAFIGYWLISLAFRLVASTLRQALRVLKWAVALVAFGLILRDHQAGTEAMALRLLILVCVCVVLGVGMSGGSNAAEKTARLEEQVNILERRLKEMERWTRTKERKRE